MLSQVSCLNVHSIALHTCALQVPATHPFPFVRFSLYRFISLCRYKGINTFCIFLCLHNNYHSGHFVSGLFHSCAVSMKQNTPQFLSCSCMECVPPVCPVVNYSLTEGHLAFASLLLLYINAENKVTTHGFLLLSVFVGDIESQKKCLTKWVQIYILMHGAKLPSKGSVLVYISTRNVSLDMLCQKTCSVYKFHSFVIYQVKRLRFIVFVKILSLSLRWNIFSYI